jgi:hypothetical protein
MHHAATALVNCPERARKAILCRLLPHDSVALPRLAPNVQEAKKLEGRGQLCFSACQCWFLLGPEVNQPGLVRV